MSVEVLSKAVSFRMTCPTESDPVIHIGSVPLVQMPTEDMMRDHVLISTTHLTETPVSGEHGEPPRGVLAGASVGAVQNAHASAPHGVARSKKRRNGLASLSGAHARAEGLAILPPTPGLPGSRSPRHMLGGLPSTSGRGRSLRASLRTLCLPSVPMPDFGQVARAAFRCAAGSIQARTARGHLLRCSAVRTVERRHKGAPSEGQVLLRRRHQNGPREGMKRHLTSYRCVSVAPELYQIRTFHS